MKKQPVFSYLLAFLMLAAALAPAAGYLHRLFEHTERVAMLLRKGHLPTVQIVQTAENQAAFRWLNGHEFLFEKQLFDLQKKEVRGDTTFLFAWPDGDEAKFHDKFQEVLNGSQPIENQPGLFVFGMTDWSPFEVPEPLSFFEKPVSEEKIQPGWLAENWENWPGWPTSPPPKFC